MRIVRRRGSNRLLDRPGDRQRDDPERVHHEAERHDQGRVGHRVADAAVSAIHSGQPVAALAMPSSHRDQRDHADELPSRSELGADLADQRTADDGHQRIDDAPPERGTPEVERLCAVVRIHAAEEAGRLEHDVDRGEDRPQPNTPARSMPRSITR